MNRRLRVALVLPALAWLATFPALAVPKAVPVCGPSNWVEGVALTTERPGKPEVFSARAVEDIVFEVRLPKELPEQPVLVLTVLLPDGFTYQVLEVPLSLEGKKSAARKMIGYPHPVQERQIKAKGDDRTVEVSLPVGGTAISSNSLFGEWRAQAAIADGPTCREATPFVITE